MGGVHVIRVLAVDPGLAAIGWAVVDRVGTTHFSRASGTLRTTARVSLEDRLATIGGTLRMLVATWKPRWVGVEDVEMRPRQAADEHVSRDGLLNTAKVVGIATMLVPGATVLLRNADCGARDLHGAGHGLALGDEGGGVMERPILFSGPMVRAILAGEKTVTRRIVTPQPYHTEDLTAFVAPGVSVRQPAGWNWKRTSLFVADSEVGAFAHHLANSGRAYARPGDTLWVRETWAWQHLCCDPDCESSVDGWVCKERALAYRATPPEEPGTVRQWRPSIFMPRRACRLLLRVVSVRAERLQEITPEDIAAEGVDTRAAFYRANGVPVGAIEAHCERETFGELWDAINGKRATWASNPWVWRVAFEVLS